MRNLKVLFITTQLPYPPKSGGTIKSWNYVKHLAANYSLSLACFLKGEDGAHVSSFQEQVKLATFYNEPLNKARSAINILKSYMGWPSLNVYRNYSSSFRDKILEMTNEHDLLLIDHYEMFQYVPDHFKGKVVLHTHNAEFMLWQRMSELGNVNFLKQFALRHEARRVKTYEQNIFSKSDLIYASPSDIELYREHGFDISKHTITYHLGNDELLKLPELEFDQTEKAITFMGTLSWEPNIDGLVWFINKVWPLILNKHSDCKLYVLGKEADDRIIKAAANDQGIIFTGFVSDLDSYLKKTRVYIAPLRFGSGMKVKVLEGLYRGVPTVTTSVGAEGLEIKHEKEILLANTPKTYADCCISLLENKTVWNQLKQESRKKASEKYTWSPLFEKMNNELKKLF